LLKDIIILLIYKFSHSFIRLIRSSSNKITCKINNRTGQQGALTAAHKLY